MISQAGAGKTGPRPHRSTRVRRLEEAEVLALGGRITGLTEQRDPKRRSLYIEERFIMGLDLEILLTLGLKVGQTVDGATLWQAYQMEQEKRAFEAGLRLLAAAPRTVKGLGERLARTYPGGTVERVLGRLTANGWLEDQSFAESYVRSHPDHGPQRLLADLVRKGVDRQLAAEVVEAAFVRVDAADQARTVAAQRLARMGAIDRRSAERRLTSYLARRGFGFGAIQSALAPLLESLPEAPRPELSLKAKRESGLERESKPKSGNGLQRASSLRRAPKPTEPVGPTDEESELDAAEEPRRQYGQGWRSGGSSLTRRSSLQRRRPMQRSASTRDDVE